MSSTNLSNRFVQVQAGQVVLEGDLSIPAGAAGIVAFVHGSGSSRHSSRNQYVASVLQSNGMATLLFDLLTAEEEQIDLKTRELRFDIDLLARRTWSAVDWLAQQVWTQDQPVGLFGASTGAAAALIAAAERPDTVRAVVSRGGRPDLAGTALPHVHAPTLFIVGGDDTVVIDLNEQAFTQLHPSLPKEMQIVPGASHLFEEPGTLDQAARLAAAWFRRYLVGTST